MYHKLPIGAVAAGGGIVATGGTPTTADVAVALLASSVLLAGVAAIKWLRRGGRH
jgi:hypothetical protein